MKNGSIIAIINVQITIQTHIIIIGSKAIDRFFTTSSISLLYLLEIFNNISDNFHVCSQILTIEDNSNGNKKLFFQLSIFSIHINFDKFSQAETHTIMSSIHLL